MSRVVVIGATGHIGSYLVPRLVRGGHEVIAMSRGGPAGVSRWRPDGFFYSDLSYARVNYVTDGYISDG